MLEIKNVEKSYGSSRLFRRRQAPIIKGVSFQCPLGETIAIIGESGSGKSTLSRLILGIEKPDKGTIILDGKPIHKKKYVVARLLQFFKIIHLHYIPSKLLERYCLKFYVIVAFEIN